MLEVVCWEQLCCVGGCILRYAACAGAPCIAVPFIRLGKTRMGSMLTPSSKQTQNVIHQIHPIPIISRHPQGWGKIGLRGGGGSFEPLSRTPPPFLGSRDGDARQADRGDWGGA